MDLSTSSGRIGLWLVGASGGVAGTVCLGLAALRKKLTPRIGLVTDLPVFRPLGLVEPDDIVIGGHEIREATVLQSMDELHAKAGLFDDRLVRNCRTILQAFQRNVRIGSVLNAGRTIEAMAVPAARSRKTSPLGVIERLRRDMDEFKDRHRLQHVVAINVASTEPPFPLTRTHRTWQSLKKALGRAGSSALPASSLYAAAAVGAGHSYVNFTPSRGIDVPGLRELAALNNALCMGCDGKTGETLMKSVLAPMFAARNLHIMSWVGHNIFGNRDGIVLDDPANKAAKLRSKDHLIREIVGYSPATLVSIEYIESLNDWKTAWNFIHFQGFLGTKMSLQFIWQGCDSILAAPLVIDLARLTALEAARGASGVMRHLACFFKSPMDVSEQDFFRQVGALYEHVNQLTIGRGTDRRA